MDAGVRHLVVLSQFAAEPDSPVRFLRWHAAVERRIHELGISYTFLRPNLFSQGLLASARTIADSSRLFAPIGDARMSAVDVRDIAGVAAAALTEPGHEGKIYAITGPAAITHSEIAARHLRPEPVGHGCLSVFVVVPVVGMVQVPVVEVVDVARAHVA